jgi:hypothetical protein
MADTVDNYAADAAALNPFDKTSYSSPLHRSLPARRRATRRRGIAHRELASSARHPGEIPSTKSKTGERDRVFLGSTFFAETLSQY